MLDPDSTYTVIGLENSVNFVDGGYEATPTWSDLAGQVDGSSGDDVIGAGYVDDDDDRADGNDGDNDVIVGGTGVHTLTFELPPTIRDSGTVTFETDNTTGMDDFAIDNVIVETNVPGSGVGNDTIDGGAGSDVIDAGAGDDSVDGGTDNDTITGDSGSDTLDCGLGSDTLTGGSGADVFIADGTANTITDFGSCPQEKADPAIG